MRAAYCNGGLVRHGWVNSNLSSALHSSLNLALGLHKRCGSIIPLLSWLPEMAAG